MITKAEFRNGHHITKGTGDNVYRGPLEHLPPPTPITCVEEAAELMHSDGCVQFPDLLTPQEVDEMRTWMQQVGKPDSEYEMKNWCFNKHIGADFQHEPRWLKLIDRSPAYEVLNLILGEQFIVAGGSLWITGKGRAMGMHLDHLAVGLPEDVLADERVRVPIYTATLHFYLDDMVEEIGPTLVIPGSHRAGHAPHDEPTWHGRAPKMISVKSGGAMLFRHDLWHGAAMNSSDRRRYMIQVHYAEASRRGSGVPITQPEAYDQSVLDLVTPRQRVLLGERPRGIFY
jgi:hypothetical protein